MERRPMPGEFYRHFKNKMYQIVGVAIHSETREELVIYQALYDDFKIYARPLSMFVSEVDHVKYPEVTQKYRFEKVDMDAKTTEETVVEEMRRPKSPATPVVKEEKSVAAEESISDKMMDFLDTNSWEEKYNILVSMRNEITDSMIDIMAASLDTVIAEGPLQKRYDDLKYTISTHQKYEFMNRLR